MNTSITKHIETTLSIIEHVPEQYKHETFEIVLNHLLSNETRIEGETKISPRTEGVDIESMLRSRFDWASFPVLSLKPTPQILLILKIAKENFHKDEVSAAEIRTILLEKFRIDKSTSALSMLLMEKLGKYVDRVPKGNRFYYRLTDNGKAFVDSELKKVI